MGRALWESSSRAAAFLGAETGGKRDIPSVIQRHGCVAMVFCQSRNWPVGLQHFVLLGLALGLLHVVLQSLATGRQRSVRSI